MRLRVQYVVGHHHCAHRWSGCRRSKLCELRRCRSELLPHVMHLVVGCGKHHLQHRGGEVNGRWRLLLSCRGGRTLLVLDVGCAAGGQIELSCEGPQLTRSSCWSLSSVDCVWDLVWCMSYWCAHCQCCHHEWGSSSSFQIACTAWGCNPDFAPSFLAVDTPAVGSPHRRHHHRHSCCVKPIHDQLLEVPH
jgi:hypothetical protein